MSKHTKETLKAQGYAGLCNPAEQCGCGLNDLRPCNVPSEDVCEPAYYWKCLSCVEQLRCEYYRHAFADNTHGCYRTSPQAKVSDHCRKTREQYCHICDDTNCNDNLFNNKESK